MEPSTIFNAADIVEYSTGSVVSKTIIKKPTGNITLFAFDTGEGLSEHTAPLEAVIQVLDGKADVLIGQESFEVTAGNSIILPANVPHSLKAVERFKMMLIMIRS